MPSLNSCMFMGHLGRDPEVFYNQSGTSITRLNLGVSHKYKDKAEELQEKTEWVRAVLFGQRASYASQYLHKGDAVYIEGRMQTNQWEDKEGIKRFTTEIIVNNIQGLTKQAGGQSGGERPRAVPSPRPAETYDNDVPF